MEKQIKILHLEDDPFDAELVRKSLQSLDMDFLITTVQNGREFEKIIKEVDFDLILADYRLPGYDGMRALTVTRELLPEIPFIFVSGTLGEDAAIEGLTQGATDYVLKLKLSRLPQAVKRALVEAENIQKRNRAEQSLLESGERFRAVADSAVEGVVLTNSDGKIIYWNKSASIMFGYEEKEILGQSISILMPDDLQNQFSRWPGERYDTLSYHQIGKIIESVAKRKNNEEFPVELSVANWKTNEGIYFSALIRDITERKQHELEREAIIAVADAIRTKLTRSDLLTSFLDQIIELFNADGSMLAVIDKKSGNICFEIGRGPIGEKFSGVHIPSGIGISYRVLTYRHIYLNNNIKKDPESFRPDLLGDSNAAVCIPLEAQEKVIGALWVIRKGLVTQSDVDMLKAITNLAANAIHRVSLYEKTVRQLHQMESLHQNDIAISSNLNRNSILKTLLTSAIKQLGVTAASVLLMNPVTLTLDFAEGIGFSTHNIEKSKVPLGEGRVGRAAAEKKIVTFFCLDKSRDRFGRFELFEQEKFISHHVAPLIIKGQIKGVLEVFSKERLDPTVEWLEFFESLATQAAIAIDNSTMFNELQHSNLELTIAYDATIKGWSQAMDLRDKETEGHTERVVDMAVNLARLAGINENELIDMRRGALLHDIGKLGVPDKILLKPDKLTDAEWEIMRCHTIYAYEMLSPISYLSKAIDIPYCHHEKWDGSGYPQGLKGNQIPLSARIFTIVDVWDAITSDRPYRKAWTRGKAINYIKEKAGSSFDPSLVELFINDIIKKEELKGKLLS